MESKSTSSRRNKPSTPTIIRPVLELTAALALLCSANIWAAQSSVGSYANGCLVEASTLPRTGNGFVKIFLERRRWYGNADLLDLLQSVAADYRAQFPLPNERIQVADITSSHGGPQEPQHDSHQTGLDADVIYLRRNHRETKPARGPGSAMDEVFVEKGHVTPNFDTERNWWVLRELVESGRVNRIFVNAVIKKHFCDHAYELEASADARDAVLHYLEPWPGHDDHFHLRLVCPQNDPHCIAQAPLRGGDGCEDVRFADQDQSPHVPEPTEIRITKRKRPPTLCLELNKKSK